MIRTRRVLMWALIGCGPLVVLGALAGGLLPDPTMNAPRFHFFVVTLTSAVALGLALLMAFAARQVRDARVVLFALAFLGVAGIFLTHALTTPGALIAARNPWVGFSAYLSLFAGALFLALSSLPWSARAQRVMVERQGLLLGLFIAFLVGYGAVATVSSARLSSAPTTLAPARATDGGAGDYGYAAPQPQPAQPVSGVSDSRSEPLNVLDTVWVSWGATGITLALLGLTIVRYVVLYRATKLPLLAGFLASALLLAQAQLAMVMGEIWHASWWGYHVLLLVALGAAIAGLAAEYAHSGSVQGLVEGLLLRDTISRLQLGYTDVIVALVGAVEAKDPNTRGHTQRVAALAVDIAQELRLSPARVRTIHQSAMLHDIGKIGVPDAILNKPGALTAEEFAVIKEHPARGHDIIRNIRSLRDEASGVRSHHERLDGRGYPDGLAGSEISLDARIIAVADVYDALTSARSYRDAWTPRRALATMREEIGTHLDARCVTALSQVLARRLDADLAEDATTRGAAAELQVQPRATPAGTR